MTVELIKQPEGLGPPLGRYSHLGVARGALVAIAGQVGVDADGQVVGMDLESQTRQAYANLGTALRAAGCGYGDIVKMTTFLVGPELIEAVMRVRTAVFAEIYPDEQYPPNTLLVVGRLVEPELQVEIEALAVRD